ncbi:MAG: hypothetical protein JXA94_03850 [Parachlamydiales bacterium]|nr:hypothetical protein [Parachlamydiales bacterium]
MFSDGPSGIPPQGSPKPGPSPEPISNPDKAPMQPIQGDHEILGMQFSEKEWAKFLSNMMNMMMTQIKHENEQMLDALKKLKDDNNQ